MFLTDEECANFLLRNGLFVDMCNEYRTLCTTNNLPISGDTEHLTTVYRAQLFEKLLTVDKGLKMRYEMLRTDAARLALITEMFDVSGHVVIDELDAIAPFLKQGYAALVVQHSKLKDLISFETFAAKFDLNLSAALDTFKMDWSGKEHVRAYFQQLVPALSELREMMRVLRYSDLTLVDCLAMLPSFFTNTSNRGELVISDAVAMQVAVDLERKGKLADFKPSSTERAAKG